MVDSIVDSLVSLAIENLAKVLEDEVVLLVGVTNEIKKLSRTFTLIQAVLKDAETRRLKDEAVKKWLENLKDVAYDVDDILDEWMTEALKSQAPDEDGVSCFSKKKVTSFLSPVNCFNHVVLRHKIGSRIKEVRGRLDDIEKDKNQLGLRVDSGERERVDSEVRRGETRDRETSSLLDRPLIVGREDEKNVVLYLLLGESSREVNEVPLLVGESSGEVKEVPLLPGGSSGEVKEAPLLLGGSSTGEVNDVPVVISIVGMGGLGKTTLAQLAYNDEKAKKHFDMRMWLCVSEDFDVKRITQSIIKSADSGFNDEKLNLDQLQLHLHRMLQAKRFLLVLDDIWSEDREKWDKLRLPFQAGALGSRIVITTRSEKVALAMRSTHTHKLAALSKDECWLLFSREAFEHQNAEERSEFEEIGRQIVNKCGGLPLAAKTIGSAMSSRKTRRQWELVLESEIWNSADILGDILPALLLSYRDLPAALKQCFAYCSVFPKDWKIEKDTIVKLWVAQGFICSKGSQDMEKIGGLYFDDLLRRSLLQDAELGYVQRYKMHDLVHDLAQSVAGSECSVVEMRKQSSLNLNNLRHLFLIGSYDAGDRDWATLYKAQKLRTLLLYSSKWYSIKVPNNLFHHFRHLRALDLSRTSFQKLPRTLGKLKHLRYLDLCYTNIVELPEEVSNCRNLQTLRLKYCRQLRKLPRGMGKMISLRHLELENTLKLKYLPQGIGKLSSLRTLTKFIVGGDDEGCKWGELKHLNHLQGSLQISGFENVRSRDEAREAELNKKQYLHSLTFKYDPMGDEASGDDEQKRTEEVLEILQPHTNLKKLEIQYYRGSKLPKWTEDPVLPSLLELRIRDCPNLKELPSNLPPLLQKLTLWASDVGMSSGVPLPLLPNLNHLVIFDNQELTSLPAELQHLTMLQQLYIGWCPKLTSLPVELQHLTMLKKLDIYECPVLEERCREGGEDRYKIAHIPNIRLGHRV